MPLSPTKYESNVCHVFLFHDWEFESSMTWTKTRKSIGRKNPTLTNTRVFRVYCRVVTIVSTQCFCTVAQNSHGMFFLNETGHILYTQKHFCSLTSFHQIETSVTICSHVLFFMASLKNTRIEIVPKSWITAEIDKEYLKRKMKKQKRKEQEREKI